MAGPELDPQFWLLSPVFDALHCTASQRGCKGCVHTPHHCEPLAMARARIPVKQQAAAPFLIMPLCIAGINHAVR